MEVARLAQLVSNPELHHILLGGDNCKTYSLAVGVDPDNNEDAILVLKIEKEDDMSYIPKTILLEGELIKIIIQDKIDPPVQLLH